MWAFLLKCLFVAEAAVRAAAGVYADGAEVGVLAEEALHVEVGVLAEVALQAEAAVHAEVGALANGAEVGVLAEDALHAECAHVLNSLRTGRLAISGVHSQRCRC